MSFGRRALKKANALVQEQRRIERHAKRFSPEYRVKLWGEREQRFYRRKRHREMRMDNRVADGGLFAFLSRCKSKYWGPGFGPGAYAVRSNLKSALERRERKRAFRAYQNRYAT